MIFGGYDPYLYPRFLNTFEQYDAILNEWNFPGENSITCTKTLLNFDFNWAALVIGGFS